MYIHHGAREKDTGQTSDCEQAVDRNHNREKLKSLRICKIRRCSQLKRNLRNTELRSWDKDTLELTYWHLTNRASSTGFWKVRWKIAEG